MTSLTLNSNDAALIIRADGSVEASLPDIEVYADDSSGLKIAAPLVALSDDELMTALKVQISGGRN